MASLTNCQLVVSHTAQEFAGDMTTGDNLLETQTPPSGSIISSAVSGVYYLEVVASPGFKIDRSMVTISNLTPTLSYENYESDNGNLQFTNGLDFYVNPGVTDTSLSDIFTGSFET